MATFDTTLGVVQPGVYSHPSLFQTPFIDQQINDGSKDVEFTSDQIWKNNKNRDTSFTAIPNDPNDPPFNQHEKDILFNKLNPVMEVTFDNAIRENPTVLFCYFFAKKNIVALQHNIRYAVNKWSGHHVGDQSTIELLRIMEKVFTDHAQHVDEITAPSKYVLKHVYFEVARLNNLVVQECVPIIINQIEQHLSYLQYSANPRSALSLQRPVDASITGTTLYRSLSDVL